MIESPRKAKPPLKKIPLPEFSVLLLLMAFTTTMEKKLEPYAYAYVNQCYVISFENN